jgi:hypothetical protein
MNASRARQRALHTAPSALLLTALACLPGCGPSRGGPTAGFLLALPAAPVAGVATILTVTAVDAAGQPALFYRGTPQLTASGPGATLPPPHPFSAHDQGVHRFSGLSFRQAGELVLRASDGALSGELRVRVSPAAPVALALSGFAVPTVAGEPHTIRLAAVDAFGTTVPWYHGTIALSCGDPLATLPAQVLLADGGGGTLELPGPVTLRQAGLQTVTVHDLGDPTIAGAETVLVAPAEATQLAVVASGSAVAGQPAPFTLRALDAYGNVATRFLGAVSFTSDDPAATLAAPYTFTQPDQGEHLFEDAATFRLAGLRQLTAESGALRGVGAVPVAAAPAFALRIDLPAATVAGAPVAGVLSAVDPFGNLSADYRGAVAFFSSDGLASLPPPATFTAADAGQLPFTAALRTAGSKELRAVDRSHQGLAAVATLAVAPGPPAALLVSELTDPAPLGALLSFDVQAIDAFGNHAPGYSGTVALRSSDAAAVLAAPAAIAPGAGGEHFFFHGVSFRTAGQQTVFAAGVERPELQGAQTVTVR